MRISHPSRNRFAFTVVEVLVVIGIIGVLAGLTLPAVQAAREAARRVHCENNLRQLALATNSFATARGGFPSQVTYRELSPPPNLKLNHASLHCQLLLYLEQTQIFNTINFDLPTAFPPGAVQPENVTAAAHTISTFLCPSDPLTRSLPYGCQSYRGNVGLGELLWLDVNRNGIPGFVGGGGGAFGAPGSILRLSAFRDGMSNTIAYAEKRTGSGAGAYHPARDWIANVYSSPGQNTTADDWVAMCSNLPSSAVLDARLDSGRNWLLYGSIYSTFYTSVPPNSHVPDCGNTSSSGDGIFAARSYHGGGVNAAMADGSVRYFKSSIAVRVWRALGTRAGNEVIDQTSY
jgi:prepilin-type processing-associated H-X9-DG protein